MTGPSEAEVDAALQAEEHFGGWEADSDDSDETFLEAAREFQARQSATELGKRSHDSTSSCNPESIEEIGEANSDIMQQIPNKRFCTQVDSLGFQNELGIADMDEIPSASKVLANKLKVGTSASDAASVRSPVDILSQRFAALCTHDSSIAPRIGRGSQGPACRIVPELARHQTVIQGIEVLFPFSSGPHQPQQQVMEHVIKALSSRSHAVMESPTGTGKTAAVLCAALAWQRHCRVIGKRAPQLIFASRTHAQLKQAISELERLPYRPTMAIVGSRESGLCIHPEVAAGEESGTQSSVRQSCREARRNRSCSFYDGLQSHGLAERTVERLRAGNVWDIEDLAKYGAMSSACPYYLAHTVAEYSELVFSPYSYLLDLSVRQNASASTINTADCVLILDEAHNVESLCREGGSVEISLDHIQGILAGLRRLARDGGERRFVAPLAVSNDAPLPQKQKIAKSKQLGGFLLPESETPALAPSTQPPKDKIGYQSLSKSSTFSARQLLTLFERLCSCISSRHEIALFAPHHGQHRDVRALLKDLGLFAEPLLKLEVPDNTERTCETSDASDGRRIARGARLLYDILYRDADLSSILDLAANYLTQLAFVCEAPESFAACLDPITKRTLAFWLIAVEPALSPIAQSTHSMILMSGTLTPLEATIAELGHSFGRRALAPLEVGHVIERNALTLVAVGQAEGTKLECTFRSWKREQFLQAIGKAISCICRSVPAGVLIFLPSYELLERCVQSWQQQQNCNKKKQGPVQRISENVGERIWDTLLLEKTTIVMEPPPLGTASQKQAQNAYAKAKQQYEDAVRRDGRAILLAVYRGRMSEGVSFDDDYARGVICVGIPFPNLTEERLKQKRMCNDFWVRQGLATVSGDAWYESRAFQAVAQALGRCIRHPRDYGSLILLDSRWVELGKVANLPAWLRPFLVEKVDAAAAAEHLSAHFLAKASCRETHNQDSSIRKRDLENIKPASTVPNPRSFVSEDSTGTSARAEPSIKHNIKSDSVVSGIKGRGVWQKTLKQSSKKCDDSYACCIDLD